jgi:hypothetical protein
MEKSKPAPGSDHPHCRTFAAAVSSLVLALGANLAAETRVYRCTTPDGEIEFRQRPCADGAVGQEITIEDRKTGWTPPKTEERRKIKGAGESRAGKRKARRRKGPDQTRREEQCWKKRQLLDEVNWKLRRGYKAGKGVELRRRRRTFEDYIGRYCD